MLFSVSAANIDTFLLIRKLFSYFFLLIAKNEDK